MFGTYSKTGVSFKNPLLDLRQSNLTSATGTGVSVPLQSPGAANSNDLPPGEANTGMLEGTFISTPNGAKPVEALLPGDTILGTDGNAVHVRNVLETPKTSSALVFRAPYFGLEQDMTVAENQHIVIRSDIAEYLFDAAEVLVPAWAFKNGSRVVYKELPSKARLFQPQLARPASVLSGGCALATFNASKQPETRVLNKAEARSFVSAFQSGFVN